MGEHAGGTGSYPPLRHFRPHMRFHVSGERCFHEYSLCPRIFFTVCPGPGMVMGTPMRPGSGLGTFFTPARSAPACRMFHEYLPCSGYTFLLVLNLPSVETFHEYELFALPPKDKLASAARVAISTPFGYNKDVHVLFCTKGAVEFCGAPEK